MNALGKTIVDLLNTGRILKPVVTLLQENPIWELFSYKNEFDGTFQVPLDTWTLHTGMTSDDLPGEVIMATEPFTQLYDGHIIVLTTELGKMVTLQFDIHSDDVAS